MVFAVAVGAFSTNTLGQSYTSTAGGMAQMATAAQSSDNGRKSRGIGYELASLVDKQYADKSPCDNLGIALGPFRIADRLEVKFCEMRATQLAGEKVVDVAFLQAKKRNGTDDQLKSTLREMHLKEQFVSKSPSCLKEAKAQKLKDSGTNGLTSQQENFVLCLVR